jgi:hypothetical protein
MARKIFVLGIFAMAASCGVIGYQALTYYFYGDWPATSFEFVFGKLFGAFPTLEWRWENELLAFVGRLPVAAVGIALSYALLLMSDLLHGRNRRQSF